MSPSTGPSQTCLLIVMEPLPPGAGSPGSTPTTVATGRSITGSVGSGVGVSITGSTTVGSSTGFSATVSSTTDGSTTSVLVAWRIWLSLALTLLPSGSMVMSSVAASATTKKRAEK